jgi:hypothetical protein
MSPKLVELFATLLRSTPRGRSNGRGAFPTDRPSGNRYAHGQDRKRAGKVRYEPRPPHTVEVTLTDDELARLDEVRPRGVSRAAYLRRLIHEPPREPEVANAGRSIKHPHGAGA